MERFRPLLPVFLDIDTRNKHVSRIAIIELKQAWRAHGGRVADLNIPSKFERKLLRRDSRVDEHSDHFFVPLMTPNISNYPRDFLRQDKSVYLYCWDVFPSNRDQWLEVFKALNPSIIFLTSSDSIALFSDLDIYRFEFCPEAICVENFIGTKTLMERQVDILEYGRSWKSFHTRLVRLAEEYSLSHLFPKENEILFPSMEQFVKGLGDSKVIICTPGSWSHPSTLDRYQGVELLTRRYFEAMAAGAILVGHCPNDLEILMQQNPVDEISNPDSEIEIVGRLFSNLDAMQKRVNYNQEWTKLNGDWSQRIELIKGLILM